MRHRVRYLWPPWCWALSALAWWRAVAYPAEWRGRIVGALGLALSLLLSVLFAGYVFHLSYQLPVAETARLLDRAPDFRLPDAYGRTVDLAGMRGRKVVLTFYRGYW